MKNIGDIENNNSDQMKQILFAKPTIGREEIDAVSRVLKSGWLTMSKETIEFEKEFAQYVGRKYAIAVNSCTSALFLALKSLGIKNGDEVIVPSFTFASTVNVIVHCGAKPIFADVKREDFTLDPKSVEKAITNKTRAIVPVHYAGRQASTGYSLPVIEDSAHLIPNGSSSSNLTCYSFYATKNMTTGEGGMLTTDNYNIAQWLIKARLHGMSKDAMKRYEKKGKWRYDIEFPGYKLNTTDISSALGRFQLKKLSSFQKKRDERVDLYNSLLGLENKGNHLYPILVEKREEFIKYLLQNRIQCSVHFIPVHQMTAYKNFKCNLPVTDYIGARVVSLPLYPGLSLGDVKRICKIVKNFGYVR